MSHQFTGRYQAQKKKKSSLTSRNWPGENFFVAYPPAQSKMYQKIYFLFQKKNTHTHKHKQKATESKEANWL